MEHKEQSTIDSYKFKQVFGSNQTADVLDEDIISCLRYDPTGQYLCLGDNAGRVIIFQATAGDHDDDQDNSYDYYSEFHAHVREFDALKGCENSQQIVDISWLRPQGKYLKLLTSNSKTIKLWKAFDKPDRKVMKSATKQLSLPRLQSSESTFTATEHHIFPSLHSTEINSISHSHNQQYLLSTDQQQSFLWSLQKPSKPYIANSIAQRRKNATNQLEITCSKMHPKSDSIFAYGMNRCELGLCDVRISSELGKVVDFGVETRSMKNFFADMVATVGGIDFTHNGRYIVSREYLNIKVWDIANTKKPLHNICVQEGLKSKLVNLFETENIYDKFSISSSSDSSTIMTGNYNNCFHLLDAETGLNTQYQLSFDKDTITRPMQAGKGMSPVVGQLDAKRRTSVLEYHPLKHEVAVATMNCFFIYSL